MSHRENASEIVDTFIVFYGKRFVKKQQMRWRQRGAHLLLQTRVQVLNEDLRSTFARWFPGMKVDQEAELKAA